MNNASELRPTVGYDNTLTHTSLAMKEYFGEKKNKLVLPHPFYSLELALCDFVLFVKIKNFLKGRHFSTINNYPIVDDFLCCYQL